MTRTVAILGLVVASTLIGLMGTDLVLPAVPILPEALHGSAGSAQLVLASYVAGSAIGMLLFGRLSDGIGTNRLFAGSLLVTALLSFACAHATSIEALILLRMAQGASASGPAVFAPGVVKALLDDRGAMRAIGLLGSVESLAPALAPILGAALLAWGSWRTSFEALAAIAALLALVLLAGFHVPQVARRAQGSYGRLLCDPVFLRYALSQACVLGGLLTLVFGMPTILVRVMGGSLSDFIVLQVSGVTTFIITANVTHHLAARLGVERVIGLGTILAAAGASGQLAYALAGGSQPLVITALFLPVNVGLGVRGPSGFYRAIVAAHGDDARASALVMLAIFGVAAGGTVLAAQGIDQGMIPLAVTACAIHLAGLLLWAILPGLPEAAPPDPARAG